MSALSDKDSKSRPFLDVRWGRAWPLLILLTSCQSIIPSATHEILDTLTAVGQPTYELVAAWCQGKQWAIVADDSFEVLEKSQQIADVRRKCHALYEEFEAIILLQQEVRKLVDGAETGELSEAEALVAVLEIRKRLVDLQTKTLEVIDELGTENY